MQIDGAYEKRDLELLGRKRIYTDAAEITSDNVIRVLQDSLGIHEQNRQEMAYLLNYEKGSQPLIRQKTIRPDIDIQVCDNVANQVVEFKLGYNWGNPKSLVQRGDRDLTANDPDSDDDAITLLNQMNEDEQVYKKDQELARYIEICGIGYQMVDIKRDFVEGGSVFDLHTLNPMFTFVVYRNDIHETPMMSVSYTVRKNGSRYFTCITKDRWFEVKDVYEIIDNQKVETWGQTSRSGEINPLGKVPVVEFIRAFDRMGCFERQISDIDSLNIEVSDFANSVAQNTQEIWWMNDADFPIDPKTGEKIKPVSGQWMQTKTTANGNRPMIQPLSSKFDYSGVQSNIIEKRNTILQKCYVPLQSNPGGGSTGTAMSMSAGWSAAEAVAAKQEDIIRGSVMDIVELELLAIRNSHYLPSTHILMDLKKSDIQPKFTRQKTFDLGTKTNAMVTLIKAGVNGRIAMQVVDLFPDIAQAWADSKETIEKFQKSIFEPQQSSSSQPFNDRIMSDTTDQGVNSPLLDGTKTGADYSQGGEKE